jgi:hypothetical protein
MGWWLIEVWWQGKGKKTLLNLWFLHPHPTIFPPVLLMLQFLSLSNFTEALVVHSYYKRWIFMDIKVPSKINTYLGIFFPSAWGKGNMVSNPFPAYKMEFIYLFIFLFPYYWGVNNTCQSRYLLHHISSIFHHVTLCQVEITFCQLDIPLCQVTKSTLPKLK